MNSVKLPTATADISQLTDLLGWIAVPEKTEPDLRQYLTWSSEAGIFNVLAGAPRSASEVIEQTPLNERGVDALIGILLALKLLRRSAGKLSLSDLARTYLLSSSAYYIGDFLFYPHEQSLPPNYCKSQKKNRVQNSAHSALRRLWGKLFPPPHWRNPCVMENTHVRNLSPTVKAARSGLFAGISHLIDVGGGTGTLSIPLVLEYPQLKVTLIDLPPVVEIARGYLARYGVEDRVMLQPMDVAQEDWRFGGCDAIFFGNFLHGSSDKQCELFCTRSYDALQEGGRIFIHEMIWNDEKDGPLTTALWNAKMRMLGSGRQRTAKELTNFCRVAGFVDNHVVQTSGCWSIVSGRKSAATTSPGHWT